jgi:hypothetical protein
MEAPNRPERERKIIVWIIVHWVVTTIVCRVPGLLRGGTIDRCASGIFLLIVMGTNEIHGFIEVIYYRVKSVKYEDHE